MELNHPRISSDMNASITPITAGDREKLVEELFSREYALGFLGQPGVWRGVECKTLGLQGQVGEVALDNLLKGNSMSGTAHPAGQWRHPKAPVGWKCTVEMDYRYNALWALGGEERRALIEINHSSAVTETFDKLDNVLRRAGGYRADAPVGAVYAAFLSGTGDGQIPVLRSTVIIPNGHLRNDGSVMTFPTKALTAVEPRLYGAYLTHFVPRIFCSIGRVGDHGAEIPKNLFQPLAKDPVISGHPEQGHSRIFVGTDLFTQWQRQAELRGFGAEKVENLFALARENAIQFGMPPAMDDPGVTKIIRNLTDRLWTLYTGPERTHEQNEFGKKEDHGHGI